MITFRPAKNLSSAAELTLTITYTEKLSSQTENSAPHAV